ncbi:MAG: hypothetical protein ACK5II_14480 [Paracoccus sp. (in: a-proteobacteria)]
MIPRFDGVILSLEWKEALWDNTPRLRHTPQATRAFRWTDEKTSWRIRTRSSRVVMTVCEQ